MKKAVLKLKPESNKINKKGDGEKWLDGSSRWPSSQFWEQAAA